MRRNLWIPDDLYSRLVKAAAQQTLDTGKQVSVAEWVREACTQRLEK